MTTDAIVRKILNATGHNDTMLFLLDGRQALEIEGGKQHHFTIRRFVHLAGNEPKLSQHFVFTCGLRPQDEAELKKLAEVLLAGQKDETCENVSYFQTLQWREAE